MSPAVERLLAALEGATGSRPRRSGDGWAARCPAHDDRHASLSVGEGSDGRALLACHAGCDTERVVAALGLSLGDLFADDDEPAARNGGRPERPAQPRLRVSEQDVERWHVALLANESALRRLHELRGWSDVAIRRLRVGLDGSRVTLPYYSAAGELVGLARYAPNPGARGGEPKMLAEPGSRRELWPPPETVEVADGAPLWLVEGEPDCLRAWSLGLPSVAVPGVQGWRRSWASRFRRRRVVICFDADAPGREAAARVAADLLGHAAEVRVLDLAPSRDDGYDLSDFVRSATDAELREQARRLLLDLAERTPPLHADGEGDTPGMDGGGPGSGDGSLRLRRVADVAARPLDWLAPGLIPRRAVSLLAGVGGLGKSTWGAGVAAALSAGRLGEPGDAIIVTYEDPVAEVLRPRLQAAGADLGRVHVVERDGLDALVSLPRDLDDLGGLVREVGARLLIIDPVVAAMDGRLDAHRDQDVRAVLAGLARLAEDADLAVLLVGHLNKAPSRDAYVRVGNSAAFWNGSRTVLLLTPDPEDEQARLLTLAKGNWTPGRRVERWRIEQVVLPDVTDPRSGRPLGTSRLTYQGVADDIDPDDVLAPAERSGQADEARAYLLEVLGDGDWHAFGELLRGSPVAERTLRRAGQALGVEVERRGFPAATYWRLQDSGSPSPAKPYPHVWPDCGRTVDSAWLSQKSDLEAPVRPNSDCWPDCGRTRDAGRTETAADAAADPPDADPPDEAAVARDLAELLDARIVEPAGETMGDLLAALGAEPEPAPAPAAANGSGPSAASVVCGACGSVDLAPLSGVCRRCGLRPWGAPSATETADLLADEVDWS